MTQPHAVWCFRRSLNSHGYKHGRLKCARTFTVDEVPMHDLCFQHDARLLNLWKLLEDRRPFANLFFPTSLVDIKSVCCPDGRNSVLFGEVRNLVASDFVLNEGALTCQLFD